MTRPRTIDRARVAALIADSLDDRQIAERLGCTPPSIARIRNWLGAPQRQPQKSAAEQDAAFSARLSAAKGKTKPNAQRDSGSKVSCKASDSEPAA